MDDAQEESKVVLLAIAGDDHAFKELVLRRQAWLRSLMRRLSGDAALADDLCQEAFLKAWRNIATLRNHRTFGAWLRRIALHVWADYARSRKLDFENGDLDVDLASGEAGGVETADHRLDLQAALERLRPGPRACVVLFYGEGLTHAEVANATDLSIGVVKSHIARSTQRLRLFLQEWDQHE